MPERPLPDSRAANEAGCRCSHDLNQDGNGKLSDPKEGYIVKEFTIHPECKLHSPMKFWLS